MSHGDHSGHGGGHGGDSPADMPQCSMNMIWNHQIKDTCVVFESWHISGKTTMFLSCLAIVGISVAYASLMAYIQRSDRRLALAIVEELGADHDHDSSVEPQVVPKIAVKRLPVQARFNRALRYAASVAISYFLMLVAMTYNTYLCSAIVVGAFVGHYIYEDELDISTVLSNSSARGLACH